MSLDLTLKNRELNFKVVNSSQHKVYEFENFRLDAATKLLYRTGEQVILTPKAVETLIALVEGQGAVIGKEELMQKIWADTIVEESNLAQYLHVLRKTLGETSNGKPYIETLKRRGYRFNGTVSVVTNGLAVPARDAEISNESLNGSRTEDSIYRSGNGQGRVRALKPLIEARESGQAIAVERSGNIYSVSDWRRSPQADTSLPITPSDRRKWFLPFVLAILAIGFAGIGYGIYKFVSLKPGAEVQNIPFRGSDITRLTTTGRSKYAAVSPDGRYVAHIVGGDFGESLWVRQVAVANDFQLAAASESYFVWVTFSPDGNFVYYLTLKRDEGETKLFRVPVLGGPTVNVANDIGAPEFSPDGTKLAYMVMNKEESRLIVATVDDTNEAKLTSRQAPDYLNANEMALVSRREPDYLNMFWCAPAWSLDGKSIAYSVNQSDEKGRYETVLAVDVETGAERKLTDVRWQQVGQPRWLADGLMVTASESSTAPQQLWHISVSDGTASRVTTDLNNYSNFDLTSDGKLLAAIQDHTVSNIWTLGKDAAEARQLRSEAGWLNELIWLPDGRLAYTSNAGGSSDIWTMNADGSNVRQLTVGSNARLGIAVTVDEKELIFSAEREGKYNLWRIGLDGLNLGRITNGDGEYYPQCTPDGQWIVYQSGGNHPTLWKMPTGGGDAIRLTRTTASRPSLSPDGKFVAYHYLDSSFEKSKWGIGISRIEDGKRVQRFDFPSTVTERLVKWTRDGKSIAFLNSPGGVPNIWLQPLDGGGAKPLTDFPSDSIISFNWNANGSQLAVIRGVETSDVVLIDRSSLR